MAVDQLSLGVLQRLRRGEYLVADGRELRSALGRYDVRHDVAAEGRTNLPEGAVVLHLEAGAVGGETGAEARRHARRQGAAHGRAADQDYRGLAVLYEIGEGRRVRFDAEVLKLRMRVAEDLVGAVGQELLGALFEIVADEKAVDGLRTLRSQFARLA
jgi:hypothetical protein